MATKVSRGCRSWRRSATIGSISLLALAASCASSGEDADRVEELEARLAELESESDASSESDPTSGDLPVDGECEVVGADSVTEELAQECIPSCAAALTFASAGSNPAMNDALNYAVAYVRLTGSDGREPAADVPIALGESAVEILGIYIDQSDPNVPEPSGYYTRWGATGGDPATAEVVYDAYWFVDEADVELGDADGWLRPEHELRETAQFLDTPLGCIPNPHRSPDAPERLAPAVETTTTTVAPTTTRIVTPQERYADELERIGEEITGGLDRYECDFYSPDRFECAFWDPEGYLTEASVFIQDDGTLTYETGFEGGGM